MIKQIFFGLFIGSIFTLFLMMNDGWSQEKASSILSNLLSKVLCCKAEVHIEAVDALHAAITFSDLAFQSLDNAWNWQADHCTISLSWYELIRKGKILFSLAGKGLTARTLIRNGVCEIIRILLLRSNNSL